MKKANDKALEYFQRLKQGEIDDDTLTRQVKVVLQVGQTKDASAEFTEALELFDTARSLSATLVQREPENTDRIQVYARSIFWSSYARFRLGEYDAANSGFYEYLALAKRLASSAATPESLAELADANMNVGISLLKTGEVQNAEQLFDSAQEIYQALASRSSLYLQPLAQVVAWQAASRAFRGAPKEATQRAKLEIEIYSQLQAKLDPDKPDTKLLNSKALTLFRISQYQLLAGEVTSSLQANDESIKISDQLMLIEPNNKTWARIWLRSKIAKATALFESGDVEQSKQLVADYSGRIDEILNRDSAKEVWKLELLGRTRLLQARHSLNEADVGKASYLLGEAEQALNSSLSISDALVYVLNAEILLLQGDIATLSTGKASARELWSESLELIRKQSKIIGASSMIIEATLLSRLGRITDAKAIAFRLCSQGIRSKDLAALC
jgi:tetratricopeptide (TPR) repeat protein